VAVPENRGVRTLVPGFILNTYVKSATGPDVVRAQIDPNTLGSRSTRSRIPVSISSHAAFDLSANPGAGTGATPTASASPTPPAPAAGAATPAPTVAPGAAGAESATAAQARTLRVNRATNPRLGFHYPYLSEGTLNLSANEAGELSGTGTLTPSIPLLRGRTLNLDLTPDRLAASISGGAGTRLLGGLATITNASISATLLPDLGAEGNLDIAFGNASRPAATANLNISANVANGFTATGTVRANLPRVDNAEGRIAYRDGNWTGSITLSTTQIPVPGITSSTVRVSFDNQGIHVSGGITADIRGNPVTLNALYENNAWVFSGSATLNLSPLEPVNLSFRYANGHLTATGETGFTFRGLRGRVRINYEDGVVTGEGSLNMTRGRMSGSVTARYTRSGRITAEGTITYQVSPNLIASVGISVDEAGTVRLTGSLTFPRPIQLFRRYGNRIPLLPRPIRTDIPIAGISLGVTSIGLVFRIEGNAHFDYGVGPGEIRNLRLSAGFNPFDENPNFELEGGGTLYIPASAGVELSLRGALAVSAGIASVSGGITATARAGIEGNLSASLNIAYRQGRFTADSLVRLVATPVLNFGLEANVEAEALGYTYHKGYQLASFRLPTDLEMGAEFPVHYASDQPFQFPSLNDIRLIRPNIDAVGLMNGMLRRVGAIS
jgi:hypothetical protein